MNSGRILLVPFLFLSLGAIGQFATQQIQQQQQQPHIKTKAELAGPLAAANAQFKSAQDELDAANGRLAGTIASLKKEFETSENWQTAQATLKQAQADYAAAHNPVLEQLQTKPEYVAAKAAKTKAEQEKDSIRPDGNNAEQVMVAATALMQAGTVVSKMEAEALAADVKCAEAQNKLVAANSRMTELSNQVDQSVKDNGQYYEARVAIEKATKRLADMRRARDVVAAQYAAAPAK